MGFLVAYVVWTEIKTKHKKLNQNKQQTTNNEQNVKIQFEKKKQQFINKNDPKCCSLRCYQEFHLIISYKNVYLS